MRNDELGTINWGRGIGDYETKIPRTENREWMQKKKIRSLFFLLITNAEKAERNDNLGGKIKKGLVKNDG